MTDWNLLFEGDLIGASVLAGLRGCKNNSDLLTTTVVKEDGTAIKNPGIHTKIEKGDVLITLPYKAGAPEFAKGYNGRRMIKYRGSISG